MTYLLISLLVFALIFGGALAGAAIRPLLLEHHLHPDSRDVVKMATGLIGTLAALVLGLLIASAKSSFDQKAGQVRQLTATMILLDDLLTQYGPEAKPVRNLLRQSIQPLANHIWHEEQIRTSKLVRFEFDRRGIGIPKCTGTPVADRRCATFPAIPRRSGLHGRRADPIAVVCPDRRLNSDSLFGHSGFLAQRDFRELHLVCANQSGRHGLAVGMRAVVCLRDFSDFGAGQPLHGIDGDIKRNVSNRALAAESVSFRVERGQSVAGLAAAHRRWLHCNESCSGWLAAQRGLQVSCSSADQAPS